MFLKVCDKLSKLNAFISRKIKFTLTSRKNFWANEFVNSFSAGYSF